MDASVLFSDFIIKQQDRGLYHVTHPRMKSFCLEVTTLSGSEFLIRQTGGTEDVYVRRRTTVLARVDKDMSIRVGNYTFTLQQLFNASSAMRQLFKPSFAGKDEPSEKATPQDVDLDLEPSEIYMLGADPKCDICLASPRVAWRAVKIKEEAGKWTAFPVHGGQKVTLDQGVILKVGPYQISLAEGRYLQIRTVTQSRLDVDNIDVKKNSKFLIRGLSFGVKSGEFIGIMGPSGAGKSVLLKAMRGIIPLTGGTMRLDGRDFRAMPDFYSEIGYVPQDDLVYTYLTVTENLYYAARLRLPSDWPNEAIDIKVNELLEKMSLQDCAKRRCSDISGGQRKRVHLGIELILEPNFLLADEICSGLSSWDTDNVLKHLRRMVDEGKTVILTIHTPDVEALDLMDLILLVDRGGFLAYYGPAQPDAIKYFTRRSLSPYQSPKIIFDVLEKRKDDSGSERRVSPEQWRERFLSSHYYKKYVQERLAKGICK